MAQADINMYPRSVEEGFEAVDHDDDAEELLAEYSGAPQQPMRTSWRRQIVGAIGAVALVACGCFAMTGLSRSAPTTAGESHHFSARMLLESSELVTASTEQIMKTGQKVLRPHQKEAVRLLVQKVYANLTGHMQQHQPAAFMELNSIHLTHEQKEALLNQVRMLGDTRMQSIGRDVAEAVHAGRSENSQGVKTRIMEKLQSRFGEIRQLHEEFMPAALGGSHHESSQFKMELNLDGLHLMKSFEHRAGSVEVEMSRPEVVSMSQPSDMRRLSTQQGLLSSVQSLAIINGIVEQARIVLDQINLVGSTFNSPIAHAIPAWTTCLVGLLDLTTGLVACLTDGMGNPSLQIMCPMRYASATTDILENIRYLFSGGTYTATSTWGATSSSALWMW